MSSQFGMPSLALNAFQRAGCTRDFLTNGTANAFGAIVESHDGS
ncbi:hypothetical protein VINI7043_12881 [Vibrio nigripulchritudo ATCC 27043]|nr:hypothetical protein VINI7043_12881 [Vibrio nigripulchritudo ATCC 27043]